MITKIETMDQLTKNLNLGPGHGGYLDLLKSIKLPESEWKRFVKWKDNRYTRNCISACDAYELLLMCWKSGHQSPIHNYDFQESWIKVLKGQLIIEIYHVDRESGDCKLDEEVVINEKEYTYLNDNMGFHRVKNGSDEDTISLHLNVEKVSQWEVFHECKKEFEIVEPRYDSFSNACID